MIQIKRAMINSEAGGPAWVEIENSGGELPLNNYILRVRAPSGQSTDVWQGSAEDVLAGLVTLRLTDGSAEALPLNGAEPREVIPVPGMDLSTAVGGALVLVWTDADFNVTEQVVPIPGNVHFGTVLTLNPETGVMFDPAQYRYAA